jgi:translation elongation factor P/translation initiation factor 5A
MPVKYSFINKDEISLKCTDTEGEETDELKKDKTKEFIGNGREMHITFTKKTALITTAVSYNSSLHHTVETPPPDRA